MWKGSPRATRAGARLFRAIGAGMLDKHGVLHRVDARAGGLPADRRPIAICLRLCHRGADGRARAAALYGAAFALLVAVALFVLATRDDLTAGIRPPLLPLFVERNDLALLVAWIFFIHGLQRSATDRTITHYIAYLIALVVGGLIALATQSRLVALLSLFGMIAFASIARRFRWQWLIIGIVAAGVIAVEHVQLQRLAERVLLAAGGPAVATRFFLWGAGWDMFLAAPWFGQGLGGFAELAETYARPGPGRPDLDSRLISWPHNVFIEVLVEKGIAGLAAFARPVGTRAAKPLASDSLRPQRSKARGKLPVHGNASDRTARLHNQTSMVSAVPALSARRVGSDIPRFRLVRRRHLGAGGAAGQGFNGRVGFVACAGFGLGRPGSIIVSSGGTMLTKRFARGWVEIGFLLLVVVAPVHAGFDQLHFQVRSGRN